MSRILQKDVRYGEDGVPFGGGSAQTRRLCCAALKCRRNGGSRSLRRPRDHRRDPPVQNGSATSPRGQWLASAALHRLHRRHFLVLTISGICLAHAQQLQLNLMNVIIALSRRGRPLSLQLSHSTELILEALRERQHRAWRQVMLSRARHVLHAAQPRARSQMKHGHAQRRAETPPELLHELCRCS